MEGLEVSEINLSEVYLANDDFRFDSEFYSQENLKKQDAVKKHINKPLSDICNLIAGPFGSAITDDDYDFNSTYRYMRAKDIKSFFIDNTDPIYIKPDIFNKYPQFHLRENDILLTVVGMNFGKSAIIYNEDCPSVFSCKSTLIRNPSVNVWYLLTYLSSNIGYGLVRRGQRGAAQPGINLLDIENVIIPILNNDFQLSIEALVKHSRQLILASNKSFRNAESFLLKLLGMADFTPSTKGINVKSFKDSFLTRDRLDAEYYQPKFEEYQKIILTYKNGWQPLMHVCIIKDKNFTPDDFTEYKYIELADIDGSGSITRCTSALGNDLPSRARRLVKTGDVLISSIEGSLSSCAIVLKDMNEALCSTGFYVVNSNMINAETLLVLFKSALMQNMLKQRCSGTILTAINRLEFQNLPIPIIEIDEQMKIATMVQESIALKAESERSLDVAKRAVEIAIEQDEKAGMAYIEVNS